MKPLLRIFSLSLLFTPLITSAAGLQISPAHLNFTVVPGQETTQKIIIANPTADVQIYEITADDFVNLVKVLPKSFTLESGARKEVSITISGQGSFAQANQKITSNISIVAKPLTADGLTVGTGAKIPLEITVTKAVDSDKTKLIAIAIAITLVIITLVLIVLKRRRKKLETGA